ncbi:DUF3710 domain-containing protein [Luteimicrobium sp. DT211]|uniref:DUF3710 domain-containing protein n=1 Tax=Luteimicrobium sp. DT211 TaxID=3393412 RepID=UPI003CE9264A
MGLFRRATADERRADQEGALAREGGESGSPSDGGEPRTSGPFDAAEIDDTSGRLDLGGLLVPGVPGMRLRLEQDRRTSKFTGVACTVEGSVLQVQAFAAPRSQGIWDEIREEIASSVQQQGGAADDVPGPFGRELLARLPVAGADGRTGFRPARFLGVDGPRWFLRGVITGRAAVEPEAATTLEFVFANTVVVRGDQARPPRDVLELNPPAQPEGDAAGDADAAAGEDGTSTGHAQPPAGGFNPLQRGPEITEIH